MRVLGLDVGERRIGVAISDALGLTAQRLTLIERQGGSEDCEVLRALVEHHGVETVVVGLPLTMRGGSSAQTQKVRAFAQALRQRLTIPVEFVDERLTTVEGERALLATDTSRRKRKQAIDQAAAQLILQHFLESRRHAAPHEDTS